MIGNRGHNFECTGLIPAIPNDRMIEATVFTHTSVAASQRSIVIRGELYEDM